VKIKILNFFLFFAVSLGAESLLSYHWIAEGLSSYSLAAVRSKIEKLAPRIDSKEMYYRVIRTNFVSLARIEDVEILPRGSVLFIRVKEYRALYVHQDRLLTAKGGPCPCPADNPIRIEGTLPAEGGREWAHLAGLLPVFDPVDKISMKSANRGKRTMARIHSGNSIYQIDLSGPVPEIDSLRTLVRNSSSSGRLWIIDYPPWSSYPVGKGESHGM